jgi:hypothetical protein
MHHTFGKLLCIATLVAGLASCEKAGEKLVLSTPAFDVGSVKASATAVVLSGDNDDSTVLTFSWDTLDYGINPVVTYTVQLDMASDTTGQDGWGKAKSFVTGTARSYSFKGKDLNNLLNTMGFLPGVESPVVVRVLSDIDQYNGSASSVPTVYSGTLVVMITPYALNLYVPGDYQGWDPASAPVIAPVAGRAGLFEGYVYIPGPGLHYFKYTNAPDWNHINYGDGGNGTFSTDGNAAGLSVPDAGYYELTADLNNNTWTATSTHWSILGDASPGGWVTDTPLSYDPQTQLWTVTAQMKAAGSFKFRANDQWVIDFGIDSNGKLTYADNPFLGYTAGLNNLSVPADGRYLITLDLHVPGKYTYSLQKID